MLLRLLAVTIPLASTACSAGLAKINGSYVACGDGEEPNSMGEVKVPVT